MARPGAHLVLWLLVLCMPLQGFGVAWARLAGALHFHTAVHDHDVEHEHDEDHRHASVERHHHDDGDDSVVYLDDDASHALKALPIVASTRVLDVETMPYTVSTTARVGTMRPAAGAPTIRFRSFVADPPERPPR